MYSDTTYLETVHEGEGAYPGEDLLRVAAGGAMGTISGGAMGTLSGDHMLSSNGNGGGLRREIEEGDEEIDLAASFQDISASHSSHLSHTHSTPQENSASNDGNEKENNIGDGDSDTSTILDAEEEGDVFDPDESSQHIGTPLSVITITTASPLSNHILISLCLPLIPSP